MIGNERNGMYGDFCIIAYKWYNHRNYS